MSQRPHVHTWDQPEHLVQAISCALRVQNLLAGAASSRPELVEEAALSTQIQNCLLERYRALNGDPDALIGHDSGDDSAEVWNDPDALERVLDDASLIDTVLSWRDHAAGTYQPTPGLGPAGEAGTSLEQAQAHHLFCLIYDRLDTIAPERWTFAGSGGGSALDELNRLS
jgi:hypothetical protein